MRFHKLKCPNCNKETKIYTKIFIGLISCGPLVTSPCKFCKKPLNLHENVIRTENFDELIFTFSIIRSKCISALRNLYSTEDLRKVAEILKVDID